MRQEIYWLPRGISKNSSRLFWGPARKKKTFVKSSWERLNEVDTCIFIYTNIFIYIHTEVTLPRSWDPEVITASLRGTLHSFGRSKLRSLLKTTLYRKITTKSPEDDCLLPMVYQSQECFSLAWRSFGFTPFHLFCLTSLQDKQIMQSPQSVKR